jgi:hypothetical protein
MWTTFNAMYKIVMYTYFLPPPVSVPLIAATVAIEASKYALYTTDLDKHSALPGYEGTNDVAHYWWRSGIAVAAEAAKEYLDPVNPPGFALFWSMARVPIFFAGEICDTHTGKCEGMYESAAYEPDFMSHLFVETVKTNTRVSYHSIWGAGETALDGISGLGNLAYDVGAGSISIAKDGLAYVKDNGPASLHSAANTTY